MACRSSEKKNLDRQWEMVNDADKALSDLRGFGFLPSNPVAKALSEVRSHVLGGIGVKIPRLPGLLGTLTGLSEGVVRVWYDPELHFMAECRPAPGARPVYKGIDVETAARLLRDDPDIELAHRLMGLTEYVGEE